MKRVIRRGVFETNSSSTHSVTVIGKDSYRFGIYEGDVPEIFTDFKVDPRYNKILVDFGEFGWGPAAYNDPMIKLSYALTMVAVTEAHNISSSNLFFVTKGFKDINDLIADKFNCSGIFIDSDINISNYGTDDKPSYYISIDGYIDHQSGSDRYDSLDSFLNDYDISLEDFIFDKNVILIISNDNCYDDEYNFKSALNGRDPYDNEAMKRHRKEYEDLYGKEICKMVYGDYEDDQEEDDDNECE